MDIESISSENLNKELAYLLGVYLTDGSISVRMEPTPGATFQLQVIDRDFAEKTLECLKKILPECKAHVNLYIAKPCGFTKKYTDKYCVGVGFTEWKDFFFTQTGHKSHIPSIIWDCPLPIKKWFIAGIMDGDGWIAEAIIGRKNPRYNIGIGKVEDGWIWEFKAFIEQIGVKTNKPEIIPAGYRQHTVPFVRMKFNTRSFINCGLFFTIERKQKRLQRAQHLLSTIIKERSTTRCYGPERVKVESGPNGDIRKSAEMTDSSKSIG